MSHLVSRCTLCQQKRPRGEFRLAVFYGKMANDDNLNVAPVDTNPSHVPLPLVVSPPSAPNLTSFLTGHIGQEVGPNLIRQQRQQLAHKLRTILYSWKLHVRCLFTRIIKRIPT